MSISRILIKRSENSGSIPSSASLVEGELAINIGVNDGTIYYLNSSGSVAAIRATSASFADKAALATTASFALGVSGIPATASYAISASSAVFATTASFALNGGGGGPAVSASYALTASFALNAQGSGVQYIGLPTRQFVSMSSVPLTVGQFETGSIQLGIGFILIHINSSAPSRIRLYASESFRNIDLLRPVTQSVRGEHGMLLELVTSGSSTYLSYDLSPAVFGYDASPEKTGMIHYTLTNLGTSTTAITTEFQRISIEGSGIVSSSFAATASYALNVNPQTIEWWDYYNGIGTEQLSSSSFLTKGVLFRPKKDQIVYSILYKGDFSGSFVAKAYQLSSTRNQVGSYLATSDIITTTIGTTDFIEFEYSQPFLMQSGSLYALCLQNVTSGSIAMMLNQTDVSDISKADIRTGWGNEFARYSGSNPTNGVMWETGSITYLGHFLFGRTLRKIA